MPTVTTRVTVGIVVQWAILFLRQYIWISGSVDSLESFESLLALTDFPPYLSIATSQPGIHPDSTRSTICFLVAIFPLDNRYLLIDPVKFLSTATTFTDSRFLIFYTSIPILYSPTTTFILPLSLFLNSIHISILYLF